jgi:hypothetical protein
MREIRDAGRSGDLSRNNWPSGRADYATLEKIKKSKTEILMRCILIP